MITLITHALGQGLMAYFAGTLIAPELGAFVLGLGILAATLNHAQPPVQEAQ